MSDNEQTFMDGRRSDKFYVSRPFRTNSNEHFAYMKVDTAERDVPARIRGQVLLRTERAGTQQLKALFYADSRNIETLTLQWSTQKGPTPRKFSLKGDEINRLLAFAMFIKTAQLTKDTGSRFDQGDFDIDTYSVSPDLASKLLRQGDPAVIAEIVESDVALRDLIMIRSRQEALGHFQSLLYDSTFFSNQVQHIGSAERVWQKFFEANTWIFGYGLLYVYASSFDDSKLERTLIGSSLDEHGKRPDATMRTRGRISSLCLVEIKTHRTRLLAENAYRSDVWAPSEDLVASVAQVQRAVYATEKKYLPQASRVRMQDVDGNPTGEEAYVVRPRSLVVIGDLQEFKTPQGDSSRYISFELFRRQLQCPEIITFDELYDRAKCIAEAEAESSR